MIFLFPAHARLPNHGRGGTESRSFQVAAANLNSAPLQQPSLSLESLEDLFLFVVKANRKFLV